MSTARTFRSSQFGAPVVTPQSLGVPAAAYPGRIATDSDLIVAVDRQQTKLLLPMAATDTAMTVLDPSKIVAYNLLSINNEIVKTIGPPVGNQIPISRGFDGTTADAHKANALVSGFIDAFHHNAIVAEVKAIETALGPNLSMVGAGPLVFNTQYNFSPQTPGGTLSPGNQVIVLTPVPRGVNGTDVNHYLYISGGTGAAEAVLITGGTAVSGAASGTVIVTCANSHSGAWTIQSATAGIVEAYIALPVNGGVIRVPASASPINIYGKMIFTNPKRVLIIGDGADTDHNNGGTPMAAAGSTHLLWQGAAAGPVMTFMSVGNGSYTYGGVMNLVLHCNGVATIGIQCLSTREMILQDLAVMEGTVADIDFNVVAGILEGDNGLTANATGRMDVRNVVLTNYQTAGGQTGVGLRLGGSTTANVNFCRFTNLRAVYSKSPGILLTDADSNVFDNTTVLWSGVGPPPEASILLDASGPGAIVLNNIFLHLEPGNHSLVQRNGAALTTIYSLNQINGSVPIPSQLVSNGFGGLNGSITCLSEAALWTIAQALNVAGSLTYTTQIQTTAANTVTALAGNSMVNVLLGFTASGAIALATDTAANIVKVMGSPTAAVAGAGPSCDWHVLNYGTGTITMTGGTGVSILGSNVVAPATCRKYRIVVTKATAPEQVQIVNLGASPL